MTSKYLTSETFRACLGILTGSLKGPELFNKYTLLGYKDYDQMYSDGEQGVRDRAEQLIGSQFEELLEVIWDLQSKADIDINY